MLSFASQPIDAGSTYTTGGDVSRFQRRTVPAKTSTEDQKFDRAIGALDRVSGAINRASGAAPSGDGTASSGPTVRIARGNSVSYVPVGAR
jgi:pilus assembly protein CpaB